MRSAQLALARAERRLVERLEQLETKLTAGDETVWTEYAHLAAALAALAPATAPGAGGELLTTRQLAERLQVHPKTVLRRAKAGQIEPVRMGQRGRGALRWPAR